MEQAIKSAESDALKRALVTFGNAFGLALYDKAQRNVAAAARLPAGEQREQPLDKR
jgi:recombination DNA repair RAD52 pathway protein